MQGRFWNDGQAWQKLLQLYTKMKNRFSKNWKASRQPRKQRKYLAKAPLGTRKKLVSSNFSKELRIKYGKRNFPLRKGDTVKIMMGKLKGRTGKITEVNLKKLKVIVEGIQIQKQDGSKANIKMQPSNLQIIELNLEDQKRKKSLGRKAQVQTNKNSTNEKKSQSTKLIKEKKK